MLLWGTIYCVAMVLLLKLISNTQQDESWLPKAPPSKTAEGFAQDSATPTAVASAAGTTKSTAPEPKQIVPGALVSHLRKFDELDEVKMPLTGLLPSAKDPPPLPTSTPPPISMSDIINQRNLEELRLDCARAEEAIANEDTTLASNDLTL